ncbi:MAG: NodT family efflux transporter outer membrane factor (OMF) lipoprotein [Psychromonas sp.]|jgi:NodT family efflux transporter outer membrane factor (OMF) lipoprotein|uniref:TolC family protein n=1 Tax=Psychromonas sp. TaxID=1884585 RepID=UPI0039E47166
MKTVQLRLTTLIPVVSLLFSCASPSEFTLPETSTPSSWQQAGADSAPSLLQGQWWKKFNDPKLDSLISAVMQTNNDLALATLTLRKARLAAGLTEIDKLPTPAFSSAFSDQKNFNSGDTDVSHSVSLSLGYELDLWGRVSATADAAQWAAKASAKDRESTAQSLIVTTASLYWKIGYLKQRLALSLQNIKGIKQVVTLTQSKYTNGSAPRLEVLESTQSLYSQKVEYSQLQQQLTETQNALSILLNQPLQEALWSLDKLPETALPGVSAGIPADLLMRRPDVKSSLYALKSALASKDAVDAGYFPKISLTSSLGFSSSQLVELLKNPIGTLGADLALPFINWHEMKLNKKISAIDYQMTVVNYRETLYQAFSEVSNFLSARQQYQYQGDILTEQYTTAKEVEDIYAGKYNFGAINMVDWIDAMETRRNVEASVLENRYNQFVTLAKIYQSLGGADIVQLSLLDNQ